jgi:hypothetical protein
MADPFATPTDVAAVWRPLSDAEEAVAATLLSYASTLVRVNVPGIDDRITAGTLDADLPKMVVVGMVKGAMDRPAGAKSLTETTGPYTRSITYAEAVTSGLLGLSAADLALLTPASDLPAAPVGSIRLSPGLVWDRRRDINTLPTA